ncbi:LysR family transcriptional regulator [Parapusillimonas granuli]|uniref:LysR family transcriptional regulator n=1 Tax=Parapusillimonas granuli TaxID=380911 RepID=A0A853G6N9_9BURK|nr:LysR family transcriptional regulator [Parapusillimonas granuli]MBB5216949.1 DNA-binding transcriptional LysR family regulator [Parapusillimonas granuli]MEB2400720.1 LysR family transcriptional regulator [Alcaligenaceae bacterium]NYT50286.1 LysR family transcriptional regulator [Parapusillimonas granuli]
MPANISSRLLYAFVALAELKHFTRAAERCNTSQSALSVMIQKLEAQVGTRLFERDTRKVALTPEGELFAEAARSLIAEIESAFENMADYVARRRGRVSIAALPSLAATVLPRVIAEYRRRYPGVAVSLHDALSDPCLSLLRAGSADLALTAAGPKAAEFDARTLLSDPFYVVCRRDHPLARKKTVRPAELAGEELVHLAKSSSVRQHVDVLLGNAAARDSGFDVEHLATAAGLVKEGLGVCLVPELTLYQFRQLDLVAIPLKSSHKRPILLVKRKDQSLSLAAQAMLELIEEVAKGGWRGGENAAAATQITSRA